MKKLPIYLAAFVFTFVLFFFLNANKTFAITCTYTASTSCSNVTDSGAATCNDSCLANPLANICAPLPPSYCGCTRSDSCSAPDFRGVIQCTSRYCCPNYTTGNCPSTVCSGTTLLSNVSCTGSSSGPSNYCTYSTSTPNSPSCGGGASCTSSDNNNCSAANPGYCDFSTCLYYTSRCNTPGACYYANHSSCAAAGISCSVPVTPTPPSSSTPTPTPSGGSGGCPVGTCANLTPYYLCPPATFLGVPVTSCGIYYQTTCDACATPTSAPTPTPTPNPGNGNIINLKFGITQSIPWFQTTGGDVYFGGGLTDQIPSGASCGPYVSLTGGGATSGVVSTSNGSASLGSGQASQPSNWLVGGLTYPDDYPNKGALKTSYANTLDTAVRSGITPIPLGNSQCGAGGINSCALATTSLASGVYIANGNLTLTGASYTFPASRDFVILVNGDLNIQTEVHVPIGSTAFFSVSGDINVAGSVGESVSSSVRANVEGYYSTDKNFNVLHDPTKTCPASDKRLNIAGAIVVNAGGTGGTFDYSNRDLCLGNLQCPVFTVIERPDFILNSPEFLKSAKRIWQEIAP